MENVTNRSVFFMLTDLRTEDSGKLGCRLIGEPKDQRFELLKDFAVTGKSAALTF